MKKQPCNKEQGRLRKPAFSRYIRIGLMSVMNRVTPQHDLEYRAIMWAREYCEYAEKIKAYRIRRKKT